MSVIEHLEQDLKEAMKAKNEAVVSTLRLVRAACKNRQIELGHELTEMEVITTMRTLVKQYRDALQDFTSAGRTDLAERQKAEIDLLERYLPAGISEEEIERICRRVIEETAATKADFGRVMGTVMKEVDGRADGNAVRTIVQKILG